MKKILNSVNSFSFAKCINSIIRFSKSRIDLHEKFEVFILIPSNCRQFLVVLVVVIVMVVVLPNCLMFIKINCEKSVLVQKFWEARMFVIVNNLQASLINWTVMWNAFQCVSFRYWPKLMKGFLFYQQYLNMFLGDTLLKRWT